MEKYSTKSQFKSEVLASELPVVVDFYADWCGPCKMMKPALEKVAAKFAGRVNVVIYDTEGEMSVPQEYKISNLPTLLFIKAGQVVKSEKGLKNESELTALLEEFAK